MTHTIPPHRFCDECTDPATHNIDDKLYLCEVHFKEHQERVKYFEGEMTYEMLERLR